MSASMAINSFRTFYVRIESLPRSEFSVPKHVLEIIEEILLGTPRGGSPTIAPIASYPSFVTVREKPLTIIIDGNHRATAFAMLKVLASKPAQTDYIEATLREYCEKHEPGLKWQVNMMDVLNVLHSGGGKSCSDLLDAKSDLVEQFASVEYIPALLVQEESFSTLCRERVVPGENPKILLPMHQGLCDDDSLGFAFPQAGQVHGRALSFKAMPFIPPVSGSNWWIMDDEVCMHSMYCRLHITKWV